MTRTCIRGYLQSCILEPRLDDSLNAIHSTSSEWNNQWLMTRIPDSPRNRISTCWTALPGIRARDSNRAGFGLQSEKFRRIWTPCGITSGRDDGD